MRGVLLSVRDFLFPIEAARAKAEYHRTAHEQAVVDMADSGNKAWWFAAWCTLFIGVAVGVVEFDPQLSGLAGLGVMALAFYAFFWTRAFLKQSVQARARIIEVEGEATRRIDQANREAEWARARAKDWQVRSKVELADVGARPSVARAFTRRDLTDATQRCSERLLRWTEGVAVELRRAGRKDLALRLHETERGGGGDEFDRLLRAFEARRELVDEWLKPGSELFPELAKERP